MHSKDPTNRCCSENSGLTLDSHLTGNPHSHNRQPYTKFVLTDVKEEGTKLNQRQPVDLA